MTKTCSKCGKDAIVQFMRIDGRQVEHIRCKPCDDAEFISNMAAIGRTVTRSDTPREITVKDINTTKTRWNDTDRNNLHD